MHLEDCKEMVTMESSLTTARRRLDTKRLMMVMKTMSRVGAAVGAPVFLGEDFVRKNKKVKMQSI